MDQSEEIESHTAFLVQVDHLNEVITQIFNDTVSVIESDSLKQLSVSEIIISSLYSFLFMASLISNIWVIGVMISVLSKYGSNRMMNVVVFILCLACMNVLITFSMPIAVADMVSGNWPLPNTLCPWYWTLELLNKTMSSLIVALLSISCYFAVCYPQLKCMYKNWTWALIQTCLGLGVVLWKTHAIFQHYDVYYVLDKNTLNDTLVHFGKKCIFQLSDDHDTQSSFFISSFVIGFVIPVTIMLISYSAILQRVYRLRKQQGQNVLDTQQPRNYRFYQTAKSVAKLVVFYVCTWTPYWCVNVPLQMATSDADQQQNAGPAWPVIMALIMHLMPFVNCAFAPLLYTLSNKQLRNLIENGSRKYRR